MKIRSNIIAGLVLGSLFCLQTATAAAQDLIDSADAILNGKPAAAAKTPARKPAQPAAKKPAQTNAPNNSGNSLLDSLDSLLGDSPNLQAGNFTGTATKKSGANSGAATETTYKTANSVLLAGKLTANSSAEDAKPVIDFVNRAWALYQQKTLQSGMKFNDIAAAAAYAVGANYAVYNSTAPASAAQQQALYEQMKRIVQSSKEVGAFADADKQLFAETLVIRASVAVLFVQMSRQPNADQTLSTKAQELAARNLTEIVGTNFADLRFTDRGLER